MPQPYFVQYRLRNQLIDNPIQRAEASIQVQFDEGAQGSIETSQLTFVNEAYTIIQEAIKEGLNGGVGITEGIEVDVNIQEGLEREQIFLGYLDFSTLEDLKSTFFKKLQTTFDFNPNFQNLKKLKHEKDTTKTKTKYQEWTVSHKKSLNFHTLKTMFSFEVSLKSNSNMKFNFPKFCQN